MPPRRAIAFVTSNPNKLAEVREIVRPFGLEVRWVRTDLAEPQSEELATVVRAKLFEAPAHRLPMLVEDSGIFLRGLGGFPGVYSRYVYDTIGLAGVLKLLRGHPRQAEFRTIAGVRWHGRQRLFLGRTVGTIALRPRGRGGFGYDPIFVPSGGRRSFAELTAEEKNRLSHRGRAVRKAARAIVAGRL